MTIVAPAWAAPQGPKLLVGVLHTGLVTLDWARAFRTLQLPPNTIFSYSSHWPVDISRNKVCEAALQNDVDWVLFLDSDVIPGDDAFARLWGWNMPVVQGIYRSKVPGHHPLVMRMVPQPQPDGTVKQVYTPLASWAPGQLIPVDTVATGLLLIHRRVLERFKAEGLLPFEWTWDRRNQPKEALGMSDSDMVELSDLLKSLTAADSGHEVLARLVDRLNAGTPEMKVSEDFEFGYRAKQLGFPLYVDPNVLADHVTTARISAVTGALEPMMTP